MVDIVLADDHSVMRQGLRSFLEEQPDLQVVGEASDGLEALSLLETLKPDVVVIDIAMPGLDGLQVAERIAEVSPNTVAVILSMYGADGYVRKAMRSGAKAFVLKDSTGTELIHAIREAIAGRRYLSKSLMEKALHMYTGETKDVSVHAHYILTARELDILHRIAEGSSSRQIAHEVCLSTRTIEFHRRNIMRKLNIRNQKDLIVYCVRAGILSPQ